jgi:PleD family two-component response regulator
MVNTADILNAKILIVDDQEASADTLKALLDATGYANVTATTNPYQVRELHLQHITA